MCWSFVRDRLYGWLRDRGYHTSGGAVLAEQAMIPPAAAAARWPRETARLVGRFTAYAGCKRIVRTLSEIYAWRRSMHRPHQRIV